MRLDYHVHLEFDSYQSPLRLEKERLLRYIEQAKAAGVDEIGISEHCYRFREFRPVFAPMLSHPDLPAAVADFFRHGFVDSLESYVDFLVAAQGEGLPIKIGLEVDFLPESADMTGEILAAYPWDYVMGSVHFLGTFPVDTAPHVGWPERDVTATYVEYFDTWKRACTSHLFDTMAHPDLLKIFGARPPSTPHALYAEAAEAARQGGVAVEVSSAGLRKPVGEIYPGKALLTAFRKAGVPITIGSDAHCAEDVGRQLNDVRQWANEAGYTTITRFHNRRAGQVPLT
ncbi:MAG: histidinol-phosphatase [Limnochordia bacterium]|jgi:histidinol-phosphatase (PHP family)